MMPPKWISSEPISLPAQHFPSPLLFLHHYQFVFFDTQCYYAQILFYLKCERSSIMYSAVSACEEVDIGGICTASSGNNVEIHTICSRLIRLRVNVYSDGLFATVFVVCIVQIIWPCDYN